MNMIHNANEGLNNKIKKKKNDSLVIFGIVYNY